MRKTATPLSDGHYARKQLFSRARLIAWSHRRRFETGLQLAARYSGGTLLDYGCGDGTFLSLLLATEGAPVSAVGFDASDKAVAECQARFSGHAGVSFVGGAELGDRFYDGRFDTLVCMEVIEHVVERDAVLDDFERLLRPGGIAIISVPVEIGLPLLGKQVVRRVAGWCGIGDYPGTTSYTVGELIASVAAGDRQHIARPVFPGADGVPFHDHKGFNWRRLEPDLRRRFDLIDTSSSPFPRLSPRFGTQAWFVLRRRAMGAMSPHR